MKWKILGIVIISLILVVLFFPNAGIMEFRLFLWTFYLSKLLVLLFFFILGILSGLFLAYFFVRTGQKEG